MVPIIPSPQPELENARGIASRPEPKDDLTRFASALISLKYD